MPDRHLPDGGTPRRRGKLLALCSVCLILSALFVWQRRSIRREEQARAVYLKSLTQPVAGPPLETPDYLGEAEFAITGDANVASESHYQTAKAGLGRIERLKAERKKSFRPKPYTVPGSVEFPTARQHRDRYYQFRLRELEAYRESTHDVGAARQAGDAFLQAYLLRVGAYSDEVTESELDKLASAALAAGSRDPMLRTYAAYNNYLLTGDGDAAEQVWSETIRELPEMGYPRIVQVFARFFLYEVARDAGRHNYMARRDPVVVAVVRWLEEEAGQPAWRDCVLTRLLNIWDVDYGHFQRGIVLGCLNSPKVDPAIVHALIGAYQINSAWRIRGSGGAKDVKAEAWGPFNDHMRKAATHLEYSWMLHSESPFAADRLIIVAKAGFDDTYDPYDWFLRSCEARLDHWPSYAQLLDALRPRWGGSLREMLDLAERCLETNRFDTFLPYAFLDILADIQRLELDDDPAKLADLSVHPLFYQFLSRREEYRRTHTDAVLFGDSPYYRTRLGLLLEQFELPAEAAAEFRAAPGSFDRGILQADNRPGLHLVRLLDAAQGDVRDRVLAVDAELRKRWPAETPETAFTDLVQEIADLKPSATEEWAREYFKHAERMVQQLQTYARGDWVSLDFSNGGLGWEVRADEFDAAGPDGCLTMNRRFGMTPHVWARPLVHFEPPFELQAVVEHVDGSSFIGEFGLQWVRPRQHGQNEWLSDEPYVGIQDGRSTSDGRLTEFASFSNQFPGNLDRNWSRNLTPGPRQLSCKLWQQTFEASVDGNWRTRRLDQPIVSDGVISIGEPYATVESVRKRNSGSVRVSGVRIRRLTMPEPPPDGAPIEERESYWTARVAADENDPIAAARWCEVRLQQRQLNDVIQGVQRILSRWPRFDKVRRLSGRGLLLQRKYPEALAELQIAIDEPYDDAIVYSSLAEFFAAAPKEELRNLGRAQNLSQLALNSSLEKNCLALAAAAVVHAAAGNFQEARNQNRQAIELATDEISKSEWSARQELYEADQPFVLPAPEPQ